MDFEIESLLNIWKVMKAENNFKIWKDGISINISI